MASDAAVHPHCVEAGERAEFLNRSLGSFFIFALPGSPGDVRRHFPKFHQSGGFVSGAMRALFDGSTDALRRNGIDAGEMEQASQIPEGSLQQKHR